LNHEIEKFEYSILLGELLEEDRIGDRNVEIGLLLSVIEFYLRKWTTLNWVTVVSKW